MYDNIIFLITVGFLIIYKMLNSNDIFDQIGFIKKPQDHNYSFQNKQPLIACLQIELGPNQNYFLDISPSDDPRRLAIQFCSQHNLNNLAINIIEAKINQAKERQFKKEQKSGKKIQNQNPKQVGKLRKSKRMTSNNKRQQFNKSQLNQTQKSKSKLKEQSKSQSPSKSKSQAKINKKLDHTQQKSPNKRKKSTKDLNNLYMKGLVKAKMKEQQRNRLKQERQKQQLSKLTFKPQINLVSEKIVQFRKTTGTRPKKKQSPNNRFQQQLKDCTFKPTINKVSNIIANRRRQQNEEFDHFEMLYRNPNKKQKTIDLEDQQSNFKPKLNDKTNERIKQPFLVRMQKALQKKQRIKQEIQNQSQYSFQPKICRPPKMTRNKQNEPIWQYLYKQNTKEKTMPKQKNQQSLAGLSIVSKITNDQYYDNLVENRIFEIFNELDGDKDGEISPENIDIESAGKQIVLFLTPIFEEMEEVNAKLRYQEFNKAVRLLLSQSDIVARNYFLKRKNRTQSSSTFVPEINPKSRQMVDLRKTKSIYDNLYEQGKRQAQQKQVKIEMARAMNEEKQLQECSFKPNLTKSSKLYIDKILGKKYEKKNQSASFVWQESEDFE